MRDYRLIFSLSQWATASQRSVFWREIPSSSGFLHSPESDKMAQQSEQLRLLLVEVRVFSEQMSQPSQSNINVEVSRVFGRSQASHRDPRSSLNHNTSPASSSHFRRMANMRRSGTSNRTNRSRSKAKKVLHSSAIWCYLLAHQSMLYHDRDGGWHRMSTAMFSTHVSFLKPWTKYKLIPLSWRRLAKPFLAL